MAPKKAAPKKRAPARMSDKARTALMGAIVSRLNMLQKAGIQFGGKRDLWTAAGYERTVSFDTYWSWYKRGDIAGRIVDMAAKTTWRLPPKITEEGADDDGTEFSKAFEEMAKHLKLWRYFERVDRLAGVGRYAVLLIGTRGSSDQAMKQPLTSVTNSKDVIYLQAYHEQNATIETWETKPEDPRFGMPLLYKVKFTSGTENFRPTSATGASSELLVHWSRVIHVAEDKLEDEVFGRPRLERPLNRLIDLDKISASTAEAYWQAIARILQAKIQPEAEITQTQLKELDERLMELTHDLRRQFTGQGIELGWLESSVPPVKDIGDFYFSIIAGAAGIPKRILFGSELGELASTTDQETWFGLISERQEQYAEPDILRAFIDRMVSIKALPAPKDPDYMIEWPPLFEESNTEKADVNLKKAQTVSALAGVGGDPMSLVTIDDNGDITLRAQTEDEADERAEAMQVPESTVVPGTGEPELEEPEPPLGEDDNAEDDDDEPNA